MMMHMYDTKKYHTLITKRNATNEEEQKQKVILMILKEAAIEHGCKN